MPQIERQQSIHDLLKDFQGLEPLKKLFWTELSYERVNEFLSRRGWSETAANALSEDPILFAGGGQSNDFHVIYSRLASDSLVLGDERLVVNKLLQAHPYTLFVFSTSDYDSWHFVNAKYDEDVRRRRIFRRITIKPNEHYRTAAERIAMLDLESLQPELYGISPLSIQYRHDEAFDVEKIGKAFFVGYRDHFWAFVDSIRKANKGKAHFMGERGDKNIERLTQLILGRVLFLYFIQKKGWLDNEKAFIRNLFAPYRNSKDSSFYTGCLEPLFFSGLNKPGKHKAIGEKKYDIPYLNGGLFEPRDDFYEGDAIKGPLIPDSMFRDLFDFLDSYNFTIAESTPLDQEVDIDPEMLGKVFENILAAEDRHASGTYYTPRTIVAFMCRECLFQFLHAGTGIGREIFDDLFDAPLEGRPPVIDDKTARDIKGRLQELKVLDPAVGSGAFLLGMLHEMIHVRTVCGRVLGETEAFEAGKIGDWKREMIGNNLFGVDNNPGACEIARLRLWLSMVVDEDEPLPLPNLDYRIVEGDTLREKLDGEPILPPQSGPGFETEADLFRTIKPQGKLWLTERDARTASIVRRLCAYYGTGADAEKKRLRKEISKDLEAIVEEHWKNHEERWQRAQDNILEKALKLHKKPEDLPRDWADRLKEAEEHLSRIRDEREIFHKDGMLPVTPLRLFFAEAFATNPGGFDIVLANPPYVRQEIIKPLKPRLKEEFGDFFISTADLYTYFYARGLELLKPGGILCFIAPNKFMRAGYGKNTRKLLATVARPKVVIDFGDLPIFEATTYPAILLVEKVGAPPSPLQNDEFITATFTEAGQIDDVARTISEIGFSMPVKSLSENGWTLDRPDALGLMKKLREKGIPLGEYVKGRFYYGIKTGFNEAFVIDEETKKKLIKEDPKSKEIIKPWLRGRDIKKWKAEWAGLYIIAIPSSSNRAWPWTGQSEAKAKKMFAATFPAVYEHLMQYEKQLIKRDDQGAFWWELRSCAYYEEFERSKIVYQVFQVTPCFMFDSKGMLTNNAAYIIPDADEYLLGYLNSPLSWMLIEKCCSPIQNGYQLMAAYFEKVLVFPATDKQKALIIKRVEAILKNPSVPDVERLEREIDEELYKLYGLTDKEIGLIEQKRSR